MTPAETGFAIAPAPLVPAARAVDELVKAMTGRAEDVDVHFELPDDVRVAIDPRTRPTAEAKRLAVVAAEEYRQAVRDLVVGRGMKADVAALQQRISQLAPRSAGEPTQAPQVDRKQQQGSEPPPPLGKTFRPRARVPSPTWWLQRRAGKGRSPTSLIGAVDSFRGPGRGGRPRRVTVDAP